MPHFIFHKSIFSLAYYKGMLHLRQEEDMALSPFARAVKGLSL